MSFAPFTLAQNQADTWPELRAAQDLLERGEWLRAQDVLLPLANRAEVDTDLQMQAWLALAQVYMGRTNWPAALRALEQVEKFRPDQNLQGQVQQLRLTVLLRMGKVDEGLAEAHKWIVANMRQPAASALQLSLGQSLLEQGHWELAAKEYQNYLDAFADQQVAALLGKGWSLWQLGRYGEAANVFAKALANAQQPEDRKVALLKMADSYFAAGKYEAARERYREGLTCTTTSWETAQARYQAAECAGRLGESSVAQHEFEELIATAPPPFLRDMALLRVADLRVDEGNAAAAYGRLVQSTSNKLIAAEALLGRGSLSYQQKHYDKALADFSNIVEITRSNQEAFDLGASSRGPTSVSAAAQEIGEQAFYMSILCYAALGEEAKAVQACQDFVTAYPAASLAPAALLWLGAYFFNHGAYFEAEGAWSSIAVQYPNADEVAWALYWAGWAAFDQKKYQRAVEYYNDIVQAHPRSVLMPQTRFAQGEALSELGQFAAAILAFEEVIKKYPASSLAPLAMGRKGDCQFTLGARDAARYDEALQSYRALLGEPALYLQARYKRGRCYEELGKRDEALEEYRQAMESFLAKKDVAGQVWFMRAALAVAAIQESKGDATAAIKAYQALIDAHTPAADEARQRIAELNRR